MIDKPMRVTKRTVGHRTVRLDQPASSPVDELTGPEHPTWIDRLRNAISADKKDLRSATRHRAVHREIWVAWWTNDEFGAVGGTLENISKGGAKIVLNARPPKNKPIWIYKEIDQNLTCVRAKIVGVLPAPHGSFAARFRFEVPCPAELEMSVISVGAASRGGRTRGAFGGDEVTC